MKKLMAAVVVLAMATSAMAMLGVPLAQEATPMDQGKMMATAGIVIGTGDFDETIIGVRGTYGVIENLLVSVDVGYALDAEVIGMAVAGQYALTMVKLPVDLAARVAIGLWDFETDTMAMDVMAVASKKIEQVAGLAVYGGLGMMIGIGDATDSELALAIGASYKLPVENLDMFVELDMVDELAIGVGARYGF